MSTSISELDASSVKLDERPYEVVNGQRVELEPMGAFESVLASVLLVYGQVLPGFRLPIQSLFDAMSKPQ